ncbi:MAG: hypothetical protein K8L99_13825 [Anaerolineae bacterium]|nr:hypothetical protein [Anaerolineae bacterium]
MNNSEYHRTLYRLTRHYIENVMLERKLSITPYLQPNYKIGQFQTLNEIYDHLLNHARNRGSGSGGVNNIFGENGDTSTEKQKERYQQVRELLCDFDPRAIAAQWDIYKLFAALQKRPFQLREPTVPCYSFCRTIISGAQYLRKFDTAKAFYDHFEPLGTKLGDEGEKRAQQELSWAISGYGSALPLDFLKELGFTNFVKPDVHTMDICHRLDLARSNTDGQGTIKAMKQIALDAGETPYSLDRMFWLVGSGNFWDLPEVPVEITTWARQKHNQKRSAPERRTKFIAFIQQETMTLE